MDLSTKFDSITLSNPLMPASGPIVGSFEKIKFLVDSGVGAIVTKTISSKAAKVPRPCIYGDKNYIMNAELWSEYSPEEWINNILPKTKEYTNIPLIISAGYSPEDMDYLIPKLDKYADAFEISTHYVGKDLSHIGNIVKKIRKNTKKPFYMKISPHIPDIQGFVRTIKNNGANGIVAINSLGPSMKIDLMERKITMGNEDGLMWISGNVIKNIALSIVNIIKNTDPDITIIGVGGVSKAEDILEFILAGADAVQMLSAAMIKGKDVYKDIVEKLPKTLEMYNFKNIKEVKNTLLDKSEIRYTVKCPMIDNEICIKCNLCESICPYFAIKVKDIVIVDEKKCFGCGLCQSRCPTKAISGVY